MTDRTWGWNGIYIFISVIDIYKQFTCINQTRTCVKSKVGLYKLLVTEISFNCSSLSLFTPACNQFILGPCASKYYTTVEIVVTISVLLKSVILYTVYFLKVSKLANFRSNYQYLKTEAEGFNKYTVRFENQLHMNLFNIGKITVSNNSYFFLL